MKKSIGNLGGESINRAERDRVADVIEKYLCCEIDTFQLDDAIFCHAEDRAAFEIACEVWFFYDDCKWHKNEKKHKLPEAGEAMLRRWCQFLRSDEDWPVCEPDARMKRHHPGRWQGMTMPIGCLLGLIMLPWALFEVVALGRPRPKSAGNVYWPFQTPEQWAALAAKGTETPSVP
jgi:hypothetical protein